MSNLGRLIQHAEAYQERVNKAVVAELKARMGKQDVRAVRDRLFDGLVEAYGRLDNAYKSIYRRLPVNDRRDLDDLLRACRPELSSTHPDRPMANQDDLTRLRESLHRFDDVEPAPEKHPDGPEPPCSFWIDGTRHDLSPQTWRIAQCMWDRHETTETEFCISIWGHEDLSDGAIRTAIWRFDNELSEIGGTRFFDLHRRDGHIVNDAR